MVQKLPQPLIDLYNTYIHGGMTRREFMEGVEKFAVGGLTVAVITDALMPNYARGAEIQRVWSGLRDAQNRSTSVDVGGQAAHITV